MSSYYKRFQCKEIQAFTCHFREFNLEQERGDSNLHIILFYFFHFIFGGGGGVGVEGTCFQVYLSSVGREMSIPLGIQIPFDNNVLWIENGSKLLTVS